MAQKPDIGIGYRSRKTEIVNHFIDFLFYDAIEKWRKYIKKIPLNVWTNEIPFWRVKYSASKL